LKSRNSFLTEARPNASGWIAGDDRERSDILGNDGARTDDGTITNPNAR
jgi:hypothetical protein